MKILTSNDVGAPSLTESAGSFNSLLLSALVPVGWSQVSLVSNVLQLKTENGLVVEINDTTTNYCFMKGFETESDINNPYAAVPSISQGNGVAISKVENLDWYLFYDSNLFYFFHNSELYGFGSSLTTNETTNATDFIIIGRKDSVSTQGNLTTSIGTVVAGAFVNKHVQSFRWSLPIGGSFDSRIDLIKTSGFIDPFLTVSAIMLHDKNSKIQGGLRNLWTISTQHPVVDGNQLRTHNGHQLFFVEAGNRFFAVDISNG